MSDDGLGGPKQRLVLSLLLADVGRVVPAHRVVAGVWGEDSSDRVLRSLRAYLSRLRGALDGVATIDHQYGGYVLEVAAETDAMRFERLIREADGQADHDMDAAVATLRTALELWRGPAFGELALEPALSDEVQRLERLRLYAREQLAGIELDRGSHKRLVPGLRQLAVEHPLREPLCRLLMLALYRSGRQSEALLEYERIRTALAEELGADPSRELQDLHTRLLQQDASLDLPAIDVLPRVMSEGSSATDDAIIGRQDEVGRVRELLVEAWAERPQVVLVAGEAGVGKSRLLREVFMSAREQGGAVLVGRCMEFGAETLPFAPVVQILRRLSQDATDDELDELLGSSRSELARLVPELGEAPEGEVSAEVTARLFAAVRGALVRASRGRPLLVALEDVHWADQSTLDLLAYLSRSIDRDRILLTVTFRTDELHRRHPLRAIVGELVRLRHVARIDLGPLDREGVVAMIAERIGKGPDESFVNSMVARSGGNPFYVEELVRASRDGESDEVGAGLRDVIVARLDRLPEESRRLVEVAAVAGGRVGEQLLTRVTGGDPLVTASSLRPAVDRHVLVADDEGVGFRHDLVLDVVTDDLLPGERAAIHGRIAEILEADPALAAGGPGQAAAELVHHWSAAGQHQRALSASVGAAQRASRTGALTEAMGFYELALELERHVRSDGADRLRILESAAETARALGRHETALSLLKALLQEVGDDPVGEASARRALATTLVEGIGAAVYDEGLREIDLAVELIAGRVGPADAAPVIHEAARLRMVTDTALDEALGLVQRAIDLAQAAGDSTTELHALITLATLRFAEASGPQAQEGITELRGLIDRARRAEEPKAASRAYNNLFILLQSTTPPRDEVRAIVTEALDSTASQSDSASPWFVGLRIQLVRVSARRGLPRLAAKILDDMDPNDLQADYRTEFLQARSEVSWILGRVDEAQDVSRRLIAHAHAGSWQALTAHGLLADAAAIHGDLQEVRRVVSSFMRNHDDLFADVDTWVTTLRLLCAVVQSEVQAARTAVAVGDRDDHIDRAAAALAQLRDVYQQGSDPRRGWPATVRGRRFSAYFERVATAAFASLEGPDPSLWTEALESVDHEYIRVYVRWQLAEALLAAGRSDEGRRQLVEAHQHAVDTDTGLWLDHITRAAHRHGVSVDGLRSAPEQQA